VQQPNETLQVLFLLPRLLTKASNLQSTVLAHVHLAALNLQNQAKSVKPAKYRELMMVISYVLVEASLLTSSDSLVGPYLGSAVWKKKYFHTAVI